MESAISVGDSDVKPLQKNKKTTVPIKLPSNKPQKDYFLKLPL